jgi:hypothetical protein
VDKAIKYIPNTAENIIPISLYKIITILKQDINEQEIEEGEAGGILNQYYG